MTLTRTDLSVDVFGQEDLTRTGWVVWSLYVEDPDEVAPQDVGELTQAPVTELATSLGCVLDNCVDDDSDSDGVPYYTWWVRIPQAAHARRGPDGVPVVIGQIRTSLRTQLPPGLQGWSVHPDLDRTRRHAVASLMRSTYLDLITPLNEALLNARTDGAQDMEPEARLWHEDTKTMVGSYTVWLSDDPNAPHRWLVLDAGVWPETDADNQAPPWPTPYNLGQATSGSLDHFRLGEAEPVLLLPRPTNPIFTARVTTGSFPGPGILFGSKATVVGQQYQWTARNPQVLVDNTVRDLRLLFPHLTLS